MDYVLVLYQSRHGSTQKIAYKIAQGIESQGMQAKIRRVAPLEGEPSNAQGDPCASLEDLANACALAMGAPTYFGNMPAAMKHFWDQTSPLWLSGKLEDKPACVFTSSSSQHGGQESTLLTMMLPLLHHGMMLIGNPYSNPALHNTEHGGGPYGASHIADGSSRSRLHKDEQDIAISLGKRLANIAIKNIKD